LGDAVAMARLAAQRFQYQAWQRAFEIHDAS
jgi:hypothetical protein